MLPKPSILKVPDASSALYGVVSGCNSGYTKSDGSVCPSAFSCTPISNGNCLDSNYSDSGSGCSWTLAVGAGGGALTIGIGIVGVVLS